MSGITIDDVGVELGGAPILNAVSATVADGEWVALIGPNGAGKSTLLRAIAGLTPHSGTIRLGSDDLFQLSRRETARRISFVPQSPLLPLRMTVREYVMLGRTPHLGAFAGPGPADLAAVDRALERLDLIALSRRSLVTLSGGEQQRAVLARALAQDAPVLLLDEPTSSLDLGRQQEALELVAELRENGRLTVVSAMHDLTLAAQYADRLLLLARGRVAAFGPPAEIATAALVGLHYGADVRVVGEGAEIAVIPVRRR